MSAHRGLGKVNVKCQILLHKVEYYKKLYLKSNLLHDVFWVNSTEAVAVAQFLSHCPLLSIMYFHSFLTMLIVVQLVLMCVVFFLIFLVIL